MKRRVFLSALLLAVMSLSLSSCKSGPQLPEPKSMPAGASFEGVWYSQQFEQMFLRQSGDTVRGIYTYKYGGTIEGKVTGNLLVFKWIDPGDQTEARRTLKGSGYLQLVQGDEGRVFIKGRWGYNDSHHDGGPWEAEYIRELDAGDPRDLEDFRSTQIR